MIKIIKLLNKTYKNMCVFFYKILNDNSKRAPAEENDNYAEEIVNAPETCSTQTSLSKPQQTKSVINNWLASLKHTHFLTVQFPDNMRTSNFDASKRHLHKVMAKFEEHILGKDWKEDHISFTAFAEQGIKSDWHYHILLKADRFTLEELDTALDKTKKSLILPHYTFCLDPITGDDVYSYCTKNIKIRKNGEFDLERIIFSKDLFGL